MAMMSSSSGSSSTGIDFLSIANPNPNRIPYLRLRRRPSSTTLCSSRSSPPPSLRPSSTYTLSLLLRPPKLNNHLSIFPLSAASHDQSKPSEIEVEKSDIKAGAKESEEAWKETLASFKEQALKMQSISQEAYELYSKKAIVVLKETSKQLTIEAEKAREDLSVIAQEISEEGKKAIVVLNETSKQLKIEAEKAREKISEDCKEIVEMFSVLTDELSKVSEVKDFHIGIPYGLLLSSGGFLNFMVTGSISAIRFGVILGGSLLALSISSKRSWPRGETSSLALKGQAAIASILFVRDLRMLILRSSVARLLTTLISGGIVAFYIYRVTMNGKHTNRSSLEPGMEN